MTSKFQRFLVEAHYQVFNSRQRYRVFKVFMIDGEVIDSVSVYNLFLKLLLFAC